MYSKGKEEKNVHASKCVCSITKSFMILRKLSLQVFNETMHRDVPRKLMSDILNVSVLI